MCDRNVKSEYILIKLCAVVFEYMCERTIKFPSKPDFGEAAGACFAAWFMTLTSWSHAWSKSGNISTKCSSMKPSGSGDHVFQRAFEHTEGILNTYISCLIFVHKYTSTSHMSVRLPVRNTLLQLLFWGDLTKPAITIASVDIFYLNLIVCLQLDITLLAQNSVKIWHCLSQLSQCIHGVTFFVDTV